MLRQEAEKEEDAPSKDNAVRALKVFDEAKAKQRSLRRADTQGTSEAALRKRQREYTKGLIEECHRQDIDAYMVAQQYVQMSVQQRVKRWWNNRKRNRERRRSVTKAPEFHEGPAKKQSS